MTPFRKKKSKSQKTKERTGIILIIAGVLLITLFYFQSKDGSITTGTRYEDNHVVNQLENPAEFRIAMLFKYGLAISCIFIGISKLRR